MERGTWLAMDSRAIVALPLFQSNRELALSVFGWQGFTLILQLRV